MNTKIQAEEHYVKKLHDQTEPDIKLAEANLQLLEKNEAKLLRQIEEIRSNRVEWLESKREAEEKLNNSDAVIKKMLEKDFRAEVALRKRGGDPELWKRFGEPIYGLKFKSRDRRTVTLPRLKRDGEREFYQNEEIEIVDRKDNREAFQEWEIYMEKGLIINPEWGFDELFEEIENFLRSAPDLERYGEPYTVFEKGGELYQPVSTAM